MSQALALPDLGRLRRALRPRRFVIDAEVEELISEHADDRAREGDLNDPLRGHRSSRLPTAADLAGLELPGPEISGDTDIGHVNLTVTDLERSATFYRDVLGLHVTQQDEQSVFLAAGDYHHHVALNTWGSEAQTRARHSAGLHHFALRLPDEAALSEVVVRILRAGHELLGATDHGVNLAVYLVDPDGNGIELMVDRPSSQWPRTADGGIAMTVKALDLKALVTAALAQAPTAPPQRPTDAESASSAH